MPGPADLIVQVHQRSRGTYGALWVHAELRLGRGILVGHNAVALLMRRASLAGATGRPKWRHAKPDQVAADLVDRNFARSGPNQLWVTDITEHPTREGKLYCAVVLDAYSRRVVGWSIDATPTAALVTNALGMAIQTPTPPAGAIIHSGQATASAAFLSPQQPNPVIVPSTPPLLGVLRRPLDLGSSPPGRSPSGPRTLGWCPRWARSVTATTAMILQRCPGRPDPCYDRPGALALTCRPVRGGASQGARRPDGW